ncbi:MAG: hypothetical protein AAB691_02490 [Patescibacteria group bacterium]|mgnify:CR=1 FL=1
MAGDFIGSPDNNLAIVVHVFRYAYMIGLPEGKDLGKTLLGLYSLPEFGADIPRVMKDLGMELADLDTSTVELLAQLASGQ